MLLPQAKYKTADIVAQIDRALDRGEPYVLNRAADGEAIVLAMAAGIPIIGRTKEELWDWYRISLDNAAAVAGIVAGLRQCDAFGIPTLEPWADRWDMTPLLTKVFRAWGIDLSGMSLTHHAIIQFMLMRGEFQRWYGRRIVVVNEKAQELAEALRPRMNIVGVVGIQQDEIEEVVERALPYDFEIALLGVGVRKFAIAHQLAEQKGCVVLDMGWALNILADIYPDHSTGRGKKEMAEAKGYALRDWAVAEWIMREQPEDV